MPFRILTLIAILLCAVQAHADTGSYTHTIYLIRHGAYFQDPKADPTVRGSLTPLGIARARLVATRLQALPFRFDSMTSSPLDRARQTSTIIHDSLRDVSLQVRVGESMQTHSYHSRSKPRRFFLALIAALACSTGYPCSYTDIHPTYPAASAPPEVLATDNTPPPSGATCFPEQKDAAIWITVASVLPISASSADLLNRFGAISALTNIQYWSTTNQTWRPMVSAASAVDSTQTHQPRADYSATDLPGPTRYYQVTDTRTYAPVIYSLEMHPAPRAHLVLETENLDPVKKWGITLYKPGGIHTLYLLEERSPGTWSYYSITRIVPATFLAKGDKKSYINRAVALYRHYMDLPTTTEPPAAR